MQDNFRKQAFGFNKKDVIDYIYSLSSEKEQNEKQFSDKIEALEKESTELSQQNDDLSKANAELEDEINRLKAEIADADIQKSRLFEEINEVRRILLDNEREFNIKNEQIAKLRAENEDYAEKCEKYAEISRDVGKTIMESKKMAADIVEKANSDADNIKKSTKKYAADILREITGARAEVETLKQNFSDMVRSCQNRAKTVELNLDSVFKSVSGVGELDIPEQNEDIYSDLGSDFQQNEKEFF